MNNKCISLSLYGNKIWYYIPLLFNIDLINKSNLDFDIVIYTNIECKKMLLSIMNQENIKFNNNLIFEIMDYIPTYSKGMFWRYLELLKTRYSHIVCLDADSFYSYEYWSIMNDFFINHNNINIATLKTLSDNGSLIAGGWMFFNVNDKFNVIRQKIQKMESYISSIDIVNYSADQDILCQLFSDEMKSGNFILYNALENKSWIRYNKEKIINIRNKDFQTSYKYIINLKSTEFQNFVYNRGWYKKDFLMSLKYFNYVDKTYTINNQIYKYERDYSGSRVNNPKLQKSMNIDLVNNIKNII